MKLEWKKQILSVVLMMAFCLLLGISSGYAEIEWYCPICGQLNHDNFCPADGTERPDLDDGQMEDAEPAVPVLSESFPGASGHLKLLGDQDSRAQSYTGPGKNFASSGGYKPWKQKQVTVYFSENGWILADIVYATAEERFVYFADWSLDNKGNVPAIDSLTGYEGTITETTDPSWGPGSKYNTVKTFNAVAGTHILVYFQENGYVYGEYASPMGIARMWFPADHVDVPGMSLIYTDEPNRISGTSNYGLPHGSSGSSGTSGIPDESSNTDDGSFIIPDQGWSAWSDEPINPGPGLEIRTRTLYRRKTEIMDWTPWIDGDPRTDTTYEIEVRSVVKPDGTTVNQWREYGYHYHYDDWTEWSENYWAGVASSTDIVESKVQYSCRRVP